MFTPDWYAHTPWPTTKVLGSRRIVEEFGHCLKCGANGRSIKSLQTLERNFQHRHLQQVCLGVQISSLHHLHLQTDCIFSMCNCGFAAGILHEVSCLLLIYFRQPESKKICSMLVHQLTKNQAPHSMSFTETLHKTLLLEPNCGHRFEQNLVDTVVDFASKVSPDFHSLELQAMCKFSMLVVGIPKQLSVTGRSGTKLLSKPAVGLSGQANDGDLTVSLYIRKVDICVWFFCLWWQKNKTWDRGSVEIAKLNHRTRASCVRAIGISQSVQRRPHSGGRTSSPWKKAGLRYKETTNEPPFNQKSGLFCNDPEEFSNVCQKKLLMMLKIDLLMNSKDKKLLDLISTRPEYKRTDKTLRKPLAMP